MSGGSGGGATSTRKLKRVVSMSLLMEDGNGKLIPNATLNFYEDIHPRERVWQGTREVKKGRASKRRRISFMHMYAFSRRQYLLSCHNLEHPVPHSFPLLRHSLESHAQA